MLATTFKGMLGFSPFICAETGSERSSNLLAVTWLGNVRAGMPVGWSQDFSVGTFIRYLNKEHIFEMGLRIRPGISGVTVAVGVSGRLLLTAEQFSLRVVFQTGKILEAELHYVRVSVSGWDY